MSKFDPYDHLNIKMNPDGTVTRLLKFPSVDTNSDLNSGDAVATKDVTLDAQKGTSLRIYLPTKFNSNNDSKVAVDRSKTLPIIVFFQGCSWVLFGAKYFKLHLSLCYQACNVPVIIVLVDYRLAPENRLPAQYEDAMDALLWLKSQALDPNGEPWLKKHADFTRCFLYGSDNGGNIVFNAALRAVDIDLNPLKIVGLIMNQPLFGGKQRSKSELNFATDQVLPLPVLDLLWELALPKGTDRDHRYCNPMCEGPHMNKLSSFQRRLVFGFGMDPLIDRQQEFVQMLVTHGVQVEAHFDEVGFHGIDIVDNRRAIALHNIIKQFICG
ncbi:hypothetical protein K2173_013440 [Erythroxylum novogranatense]|uniref:Alpha/beta hydrolase fold-3 domain-containing protein n=1 Tax=Erythroxylum novogranatense TaxID=1862640 RepID=A0AAV8SAE4_9ROSI|nr:hypothetical protein K2173_013440 [Erythroxylum novogranatense]